MSAEQRETLDIDILFVGAGPASLAGAYHLGRLIQDHNAKSASKIEVSIAILEKGAEISSHALSGAVVDPRAFKELMPETWHEAPFEGAVCDEEFLYLTEKSSFSLPVPPPLKNSGKYVASLGRLVKWLAPKVEELGIDIFCEFPAMSALTEETGGRRRVIGVRTGDKGIDKHGKPKDNHEPGVDIRTQVVVLGEGPRGTLAKQLDGLFGLSDGRNPQVYAVGIKEIWELPPGRIKPGKVVHSMGYPNGFSVFGGGFVYGMGGDQVIVGLVVGLDYQNPWLDPHNEFNRFKQNPWVKKLLEGGRMSLYGAKAIPEGGWYSMPRNDGPGFLVIGDSGGFVNNMKLKGVHLGMKSGMLAAETLFEALKEGGITDERLARYQQKVEQSWIREEMWPSRNFHQAFDYGALGGMLQTGLGMVTGGRGWGVAQRLAAHPGHEQMAKVFEGHRERPRATVDGKLTFDKLADVYNSGASHEEDQPVHLRVANPDHCVTVCTSEYANPCQRFCPANVYEIVEDTNHTSGRRLQINASNCVHCKTCDIMDPYQIITWVPPEGGGGPSYSKM